MSSYPRQIGKGWTIYFDEETMMPYVYSKSENMTHWTENSLDDGWVVRKPPGGDIMYYNVLTDEASFDKPASSTSSSSSSSSDPSSSSYFASEIIPPLAPEPVSDVTKTSTTTPHDTRNEYSSEDWFHTFLHSTETQRYRNIFIKEECTDFATMKLFSDNDLNQLGIKKGARMRILNYMQNENATAIVTHNNDQEYDANMESVRDMNDISSGGDSNDATNADLNARTEYPPYAAAAEAYPADNNVDASYETSSNFQSVLFEIPSHAVGAVLGTGGSIVRATKAQTGVEIRIAVGKGHHQGIPRKTKVTISGLPHQIAAARDIVDQQVYNCRNGTQERSAISSMPSNSQNRRDGDWTCSTCETLNFSFRTSCLSCNIPKPDNKNRKLTNNTCSNMQQIVLNVQTADVKLIIGKKGHNIKRIIKQSGAKLSFRGHEEKQDINPGWSELTIIGNEHQISTARSMVEKHMNSDNPQDNQSSIGEHRGRYHDHRDHRDRDRNVSTQHRDRSRSRSRERNQLRRRPECVVLLLAKRPSRREVDFANKVCRRLDFEAGVIPRIQGLDDYCVGNMSSKSIIPEVLSKIRDEGVSYCCMIGTRNAQEETCNFTKIANIGNGTKNNKARARHMSVADIIREMNQ